MHQKSPENSTHSPEAYTSHITELIKSTVITSETYRTLRSRATPHPDAFRQAAETVAADKENTLSLADRSLLQVTAGLGIFVEAQHELTSIKADTPQADRTIEHRLLDEHIIPFNHRLKDFINTHPNDELRTVSSALMNTYRLVYGRYDCLPREDVQYGTKPNTNEAFQGIQACLDGMRHEVAAESMLSATDYAFDYKVTTQEDATGADLFVYIESIHGGQPYWQGVDVKASQNALERSLQSHPRSRAVWTGLGWEDFTGQNGKGRGTLSIPYDTASEKADQFIDNIYDMVRRLEASHRRAGSHALRAAHR